MARTCNAIQENETLWRFVSSCFSSNTYIQRVGAPGECFVVDPGLDAPAVDAVLASLNLRPRTFCTQGHFDHVGSATFLQKKYDAAVFLSSADQWPLNSNNFLLLALNLPHRIELPILNLVSDGNRTVSIGTEQIRFDSTPGHTLGSCIIAFRNTIFTGDTLFIRGVENSKFPGANAVELRTSLRRIWNCFPSDALVCVGNGSAAEFGWARRTTSGSFNSSEYSTIWGMASFHD